MFEMISNSFWDMIYFVLQIIIHSITVKHKLSLDADKIGGHR